MALITRNTKTKAKYQQWVAADIANGDILGVFESLGRPACSVTIESLGGATTLRFNVIDQVRANHGIANPWVDNAEFWEKPGIVDEREIEQPNIIVEADSTQTWLASEICVTDIKVVSKSTGLKITVI